MRTLLICTMLMLFGLFGRTQERDKIDSRTVGEFDVNKYMGQWYEVARLNHPMERGLIGVTATYSLLDNGQVRVFNKGYDVNKNYKEKSIEGHAKLDEDGVEGKFRVTFYMLLTADYYILELDRDSYSYALIGNGTPDYLWIMSRTPQLPHSIINHLLECAMRRGYNVSDLIYVDHKTHAESKE